MKTVFDYEDYKHYLKDWIANQPKGGRGIKSTFAEAARCQTAFISQVLHGKAHLNLDQAQAMSQVMSHSSESFHFFILLIQLKRAGTPKLRDYFSEQIQFIREERLMIKNRIRVKQAFSQEDQATYYSNWLYAAVHIAVTCRALQTIDALAKYFRLPVKKITRTVEFLASVGLIKATNQGSLQIGEARIHLGGDSPFVSKNHSNWRLRALQSLERERTPELHYSSVITVSRADVRRIKDLLIDSVEKTNGLVAASPEEELWCLALDFFEVD